MDKKVFTDPFYSIKFGDKTPALLFGQVFQKKVDAENGNPVIRVLSNGKKCVTIRVTVNRKGIVYAYGEEAIPAGDVNGNVQLYINCMITDSVEKELLAARLGAGANIELIGMCAVSAGKDGKPGSLWMTNCRVLRGRPFGSKEYTLDKSAAIMTFKDNDGNNVSVSAIAGTVTRGYQGAPAITAGSSKNGLEYRRWQIKTSMTQNEKAAAFAGLVEPSDGGASDVYVSAVIFGRMAENLDKRNLDANDKVILFGQTSVNEYNGNKKAQIRVNSVTSIIHAKKPETQPAETTSVAPVQQTAQNTEYSGNDFNDLDVNDDDDLPF